jgi:hypothetical protein
LLIIVGIIYFVYQALSNPYSGMGPLGSTHIHADIAIYLNGKPITPFSTKYFLKSRYIHVEHGPGAGYVIHMHATNIPLGFFFKSLGMSFSKDCFILDDGSKYCNNETHTLKFYVKHKDSDWLLNEEFEKYVFKDLDKILISYGNESLEEIKAQQDSVTDYAKDN